MKKTLSLLCILALCAGCSGSRVKFEPYVIENLEPKPEFWKVRPDEIISVCRDVRVGRSEIIARTPGGYPVYAVFYGDFSEPAPQTNWSAGNSSSAKSAYLGQTDHKPTILLYAGVHGSECEPVAAACNMIRLLETGRDFRGAEDLEFTQLCDHYRLIIVPCVNMDGRSITPDHLRAQPYEVFRGCSQGWWKDGSLVGWRASKEWFPLPLDKVKFPGGYTNADGYNIQHDAAPGNTRTEEAKAIYRLAERWRVDFALNCHSCEGGAFIIRPSNISTDWNLERGTQLADMVNAAFRESGLNPRAPITQKPNETINLTTTLPLCCGGLSLTLECCHCCYNEDGYINLLSFERMMEPPFVAMKMIMRDGLDRPLANR